MSAATPEPTGTDRARVVYLAVLAALLVLWLLVGTFAAVEAPYVNF